MQSGLDLRLGGLGFDFAKDSIQSFAVATFEVVARSWWAVTDYMET